MTLMNRMLKSAVLGSCLSLIAPATSPAAPTGNDFHAMCQGGSVMPGLYVFGLHDGLNLSEDARFVGLRICVPSGVTAEQMGDVLCRSLDKTPELRHLPVDHIALAALSVSWPCSARDYLNR